MNIVKGVADLIRRTSSGQNEEFASSASQAQRLSPPGPKIRFRCLFFVLGRGSLLIAEKFLPLFFFFCFVCLVSTCMRIFPIISMQLFKWFHFFSRIMNV